MATLQEHIKALNAKSAAWVAESPKNRWAGMLTEDLEHWASYGITTVEEFEASMAKEDEKERRKNGY